MLANARIFDFDRPMTPEERLVACKVIRAMRDYLHPHKWKQSPVDKSSAISYCEGREMVDDLDNLDMDGFGIQCDLMDMRGGIKPIHPLLLTNGDIF